MSEAKQVIVMRNDLGMRKGKMIAQGAHASIAWLTNRLYIYPSVDEGSNYHAARVGITQAEHAWVKGRFTKICVRVDSEEELLAVHQAALDAGLVSYLITDAGLTEFHGIPTNTCCAIGPDFEEKIDAVTGDLRLL